MENYFPLSILAVCRSRHLAPDGVYLAPSITLGTVRSYRAFSPLPCYRRFIFCGTVHRHRNPMHTNCFNVLACARHPTHGVRTFLSPTASWRPALRMQLSKSKHYAAGTSS